jgi:hypothetical protein
MAGAVASQAFDLAQAVLTLGMMALAVGTGTVAGVRRWQGLDGLNQAQWSPEQIATERYWRVGLVILLVLCWAIMAFVLIKGALTPGILESLPKSLGSLPLPAWLALPLAYRGLWYLLWATATWFTTVIGRRDGAARPYKLAYGFIGFLAAASVVANLAGARG